MTKELLCPHCFHDSVIWEDTVDSGNCLINGNEGFVEKQVGYCQDCGRIVEWETCYQFIGYRNEKAYKEE